MGLTVALTSIVPHHSTFTFPDKNKDYDYKNIPRKKPLQGSELKALLQDSMERYKLHIYKLVPAATQANAAFNHTVASFCHRYSMPQK